jgi:hypothetical protein
MLSLFDALIMTDWSCEYHYQVELLMSRKKIKKVTISFNNAIITAEAV